MQLWRKPSYRPMVGEDRAGIEIDSSAFWYISVVEETTMMPRRLSIVLMIFSAMLTSEDSMAREGVRNHDNDGFRVDSPSFSSDFYYWPYYSFPPYYSSPSTIMHSTPPAYIDQGTVLYNTQPLTPSNLDYCSDPAGYYPYVNECRSGWRRIEPQLIEQQPGYRYYCIHPAGSYSSIRECSPIWRNVVP